MNQTIQQDLPAGNPVLAPIFKKKVCLPTEEQVWDAAHEKVGPRTQITISNWNIHNYDFQFNTAVWNFLREAQIDDRKQIKRILLDYKEKEKQITSNRIQNGNTIDKCQEIRRVGNRQLSDSRNPYWRSLISDWLITLGQSKDLKGNHLYQAETLIIIYLQEIRQDKLVTKFKNNFSENGKQIDYIISHKSLQMRAYRIDCQLREKGKRISDHRCIFGTYKLTNYKDLKIPIYNQNKILRIFGEIPKNSQEFSQEQLQNNYNVPTYQEHIKKQHKENILFTQKWQLKQQYQNMTTFQIMQILENIDKQHKIVKFKIPYYEEWNEAFAEKLEHMRRYNSKQYYQYIKHSTQLGKIKNNSIMNIIMDGNEVITDYKIINQKCIQQLIRLQGLKEEQNIKKEGNIDLKGLKTLVEEIEQGDKIALKYKNYNKAIAEDWMPMKLLLKTKNQNELFDLEKLNKLVYALQMRIVPLNKKAPEIGRIEDMRPIIVMSHVIKMIEYPFVKLLKEWVNRYIDPSQTGFIERLSTQVQATKLMGKLQAKGQQKNVIFIDFSNAYNSVNRRTLFDIMRDFNQIHKQQLISDQNIEYLERLYDNLFLFDPIEKKRVYLENGLHQGSILSPFLFNIFINKMIEEFKDRINRLALYAHIRKLNERKRQLQQTELFMYADDIALKTNSQVSGEIYQELQNMANKYNLKINQKKTVYMQNKDNEQLQKLGIEKVENFKYLGFYIGIRGNLNDHYKKTKGIILHNARRIKRLNKLLPVRHCFTLWRQFIEPYFTYINQLIYMNSITGYLKWNALRRRSLRIAMSLHKAFPSEIINKLIGSLNERGVFRKMQEIQEERIANYITYLKHKEIIQELNIYHKEYWLGIPVGRRVEHILEIIYQQNIKRQLKEKKEKRKLMELERMEKDWIKCRQKMEQENPTNVVRHLELGIIQGKNYKKIQQYEQKQEEKNISYGEIGRFIWNKNAIRRIPGYKFFKLFGFAHLQCKEHKHHLTFKHILEQHCTNVIQHAKTLWEYIWDEKKETTEFYKKKGMYMIQKVSFILKEFQKKFGNLMNSEN